MKRIISIIVVLLIIMTLCSCSEGKIDGTKNITVKIIHCDKTEHTINITTDADTLRAALEEKDLISGDESDYGLYVKTVDGERADYEIDGAYWSFAKNGEILMSGVDSTYIADGEQYEITYTKD